MASVLVNPVQVDSDCGGANSLAIEYDNMYAPQHRPIKNIMTPISRVLLVGRKITSNTNNAVELQDACNKGLRFFKCIER